MTTKAPPCNCRYCNVCAILGIAYPPPVLAADPEPPPQEKPPPKPKQPSLFDTTEATAQTMEIA
jgi:hypothetical protein